MSEDQLKQLKEFITSRFDSIDSAMLGIKKEVKEINIMLNDQGRVILSVEKDVSFVENEVGKLELEMKERDQQLWDALRKCDEVCKEDKKKQEEIILKFINGKIENSKLSIKEWVLVGLVGVLSFVVGILLKIKL